MVHFMVNKGVNRNWLYSIKVIQYTVVKITLAHRMLIILKLFAKVLFLSADRDEAFVFILCIFFIRFGNSVT